MAVAGLVLGIMACLFAFVPVVGAPLGIILAIIAIPLSAVALNQAKQKKEPTGVPLTGLITGIVAILIVIIWGVIIVGGINEAVDNLESDTQSETGNSEDLVETNQEKMIDEVSNKPTKRQIAGEETNLGAGTFVGGTHVKAGLYDVATTAGSSGNFIVNEGSKVNEILGGELGVNKIRVRVSNGDSIEILGLSDVLFTPVRSAFVTEYKSISLHTGMFIVGEDIAEGRYVATPGAAGQSGNFIVNEGWKANEILGGELGVPRVTLNLIDGDVITLSGLNTTIFTPSN